MEGLMSEPKKAKKPAKKKKAKTGEPRSHRARKKDERLVEEVMWGMDAPHERKAKQIKAQAALDRAYRLLQQSMEELEEMGIKRKSPKVAAMPKSATGFGRYQATLERATEVRKHAEDARRSVQKAHLELLRAESSELGGYELGDEKELEDKPADVSAAIAKAIENTKPKRRRRGV
jgi:hypothetical protein